MKLRNTYQIINVKFLMDVVLYVEQGIWLKILKQRRIWEIIY